MNCAFCAFGARWGVVRRAHEWSVDEVAGAAVRFAREGASWIVLRTTEHYGRTRLRALAEAVRKVVPQDRALVANTGQMGPEEAAALKAAGISVIYHALRLGEGRDTPFDPAERRAALGACRNFRAEAWRTLSSLWASSTATGKLRMFSWPRLRQVRKSAEPWGASTCRGLRLKRFLPCPGNGLRISPP